jgi:tetratricopeptide (TPR) repeat protein
VNEAATHTDSPETGPRVEHRRGRTTVRRLLGVLLAASALAWTGRADADPDKLFNSATSRVNGAAIGAKSIQAAIAAEQKKERSAQERLADAVLLMGVKDYDKAANVLNQVVMKYSNHPTAYAEGLKLLGETYFLDEQYLSSRRIFNKILEKSSNPRLGRFSEHAAVRLVDIALRLKELDTLDALITRIGNITGAQSGIAYAKGKAYVAQGKLGAAATALQGVKADSQFHHQAKYLEGVIAVEEAKPPPPPEGEKPKPVPKGQYAKAIARFREVTKLEGDTPEHKHVIDLAWLAVGRLMYESNQYTQAVKAYNRIDRNSPEFGTMLYELAWVYVRLGDVVRAQRALEVLAVAAPNSQDVADASLLRGDLMLRAGQFEKSRKVYESVRGTYEAMRVRLDEFLGTNTDPGVYFDTLSQDQLELFEAGKALPKLVLQWAREGEDGERAFAIIDDVALCRRLIKESNDMIERLNAVLASPSRIRAVPGLKAGAERGLGLLNSVAKARVDLAQGMDEVSDDLSPQLAGVRAQRKKLEQRLGLVPVTAADFAKRERSAKKQWNKVSQSLQRLELEVDTLQATINGLERLLKDGPQAGVVRSPAQTQQFRASLGEQKKLLKYYRDQIKQLRKAVEAGKVQVGFGDSRFVEDAKIRKQYKALLWQEVQLATQGQGGSGLASYANKITPLLKKADGVDNVLQGSLTSIDKTVLAKTGEIRKTVQRETVNIVDYSLKLEELDKEARDVVGGVAARNFGRVRDRLKSIVLRADVGITEEAWELREEQLTRVRRLKIERARGVQRLREELEEVLDDTSDPEEDFGK